MKEVYSIKDARNKIEHYCAYQERCHTEVEQKLRTMKMDSEEIDEIIAHLIGSNFLNEERFACSFARGKHRIKQWGKIRITNELKFRKNKRSLNQHTAQINLEEYEETFQNLADRTGKQLRDECFEKERNFVITYCVKGLRVI
jgi:regulatory protein